MNFKEYLSDKLIFIISEIVVYLLFLLVFLILKIPAFLFIVLSILYFLPIILYLAVDFYKRNKFYQEIMKIASNLDKKYLLSELILDDDFYDAKYLKNITYLIDKSYIENINNIKQKMTDFKDYLELWCHEIKTPIATMKLIIENNKNKTTNNILESVLNEEYLIEQVLFYARMDNLENDYLIKKVNVKQIINNVIKKNKKSILTNKIKLKINFSDYIIATDEKWLEFIINQIVSNSIKYIKNNPLITFDLKINPNNIILAISDNGIGIKEEDIKRVFNKGFTGSNGRLNKSSTGMGLYLVKMACKSLNYEVSISSKENEGTTIFLVIPKCSLINF